MFVHMSVVICHKFCQEDGSFTRARLKNALKIKFIFFS